jgi:sulfur-oxidizing protein SoxY
MTGSRQDDGEKSLTITDTSLPEFAVTRRLVLEGAFTIAVAGLGTIPLGFATALAAANDQYPQAAFNAKNDSDAIRLLYGKSVEPSDKIKLDAPEIAENGAVVPVSVGTDLADVSSIAILVSENPNTLAAFYPIPAGILPVIANRLKMAKTTNVVAIVEAGGKLYSTTREVKVTVGGCGG